jgi:hypothetical protein
MTNAGKKGQRSFIKIACLLASQSLLVLILFRFKYMVQDLSCNLTVFQLLKSFLSPITDEGVPRNSVFALLCLIIITEESEFLRLGS